MQGLCWLRGRRRSRRRSSTRMSRLRYHQPSGPDQIAFLLYIHIGRDQYKPMDAPVLTAGRDHRVRAGGGDAAAPDAAPLLACPNYFQA